jgi:hypothetical protein
MLPNFRTAALSLAAAAVFATGNIPRPASANTASTLTTLAGAAAVVGGIVLYNNYKHKQQAANQVVGYTRNGGSILGDGRIVMPNGQTIAPSTTGQYPWGQYAYYNDRFNSSTAAYDTDRSGKFDRTHHHDNGLHRGWYKHDAAGVNHYTAAAPPAHPQHVEEERGRGDRDDAGKHGERGDHGNGQGNGNGHGHGHD